MPESALCFVAGPGARLEPGRIPAHDGRAAAQMAAAYALVSGEPGRAVALGDWDFDEAIRATAGGPAPVECALERHGIVVALESPRSGRAAPLPAPAPIDRWKRVPGRPVALERLAAEIVSTLPFGSVLCVDMESPEAALAAAAAHPDLTAIAVPGGVRGAGTAWAVGAKAAVPDRSVVALVDSAAFATGAPALLTAVRLGIGVAVVVASGDQDLLPYEHLAAVVRGHGECVTDPARLGLHLRNAAATSICSVINVAVRPAAVPSCGLATT